MKFAESFQRMEKHVQCKMGTGVGTDNPETSIRFNGQPVAATLTPIEVVQPFEAGGYVDTPTCTIAIGRADFEAFGQPTLGKNRFLVGDQELRVMKRGLDTLSGEVSLQCGPVDI